MRTIRSKSEYEKFCSDMRDTIKQWNEYEQKLSEKFFASGKEFNILPGYCDVCGTPTLFRLDGYAAEFHSNGLDGNMSGFLNFRERMVCELCHLNARQRFLLAYLKKYGKLRDTYTLDPRIYIMEQVTPFYQHVKKLFAHIEGSEYMGDEYAAGEIIGDIRHENVSALSFENASFTVVLSADVFEHVFGMQNAFKECHRVLDTGGRLIFSVPFDCNSEKSQIRAEIASDGKVKYILEPVYHGNPVSEDGSLVVSIPGWDMLNQMIDSGFKDAHMICYHDRLRGYLGGLQFIFEAVA